MRHHALTDHWRVRFRVSGKAESGIGEWRHFHLRPGDSGIMNPPIAANSTMLKDIVSESRPPIPVYRALTGFVRCDGELLGKGSAAVAQFMFASGTVFLCGHHTRLALKKIRATAKELWVEPAELFDEDRDLRAQMEALAAVHRPVFVQAAKKSNGFV